jgi:hypothetical protein
MELARLHRRVAIAQHQREIALAQLELEALMADHKLAESEGALTALLPRWHLRELQNHKLADHRRDLLYHLRDTMPPVFELRHPGALAALNGLSDDQPGVPSAKDELDALATIDFATSIADVSRRYLDFARLAILALTNVQPISQPKTATVWLSFPKPDVVCGGPLVPCPFFRTVDSTRAKTVWDAIEGVPGELSGLDGDDPRRFIAEITLTPRDLYRYGGGDGLLDCVAAAPVILDTALYAVVGTARPTTNGPGAWAGRGGVFPTATGRIEFAIPDPPYPDDDFDSWRTAMLPFHSGKDTDAVGVQLGSSSFAGLSPFSTFRINLSTFKTLFGSGNPTQLLLGFKVEYRTSSPGVKIKDVCPLPPPDDDGTTGGAP